MNLIERRRGMVVSGGKQQGTLVVYPSGYDNVDIKGYVNNVGRMYTGSDSTSCGYLFSDYQQECWLYLTFDMSALPSNATILSASCTVKGFSQAQTKQFIMYSSAVPKETKNMGTSASVSEFDLSHWSASELKDAKLKVYGNNNAATNYAIAVYGATLTINYEY